jgi:hypothetical protein
MLSGWRTPPQEGSVEGNHLFDGGRRTRDQGPEKTSEGYYNLERMLRRARRPSLANATTADADKVLAFSRAGLHEHRS